MSYEKAKAFVKRREGGRYHPTHNAYDPNPTKWGITQNTYAAAGYPGSVYDMTEPEWDAIFTRRFWKRAGCHLWPEPLDLVIADPAFNSGPKQALKFLQRAVQASPDGVFGPQTLDMVKRACREPAGIENVCIRVQGQRIRFLKDLYAKSVQRRTQWDTDPRPEAERGDRPALAPISNWLDRVTDLARTVGLH
jgi:lysozyme family protein